MATARLGRRLARCSLAGGAAFSASQAWLLYKQPCWRDAATVASSTERHPDALSATHARTAVVVGAGVAGVCTAYQLAQRGFEVLVLDAGAGAAAKGSASAAAAGGMDVVHHFSTAKDWLKMFRQLLPFGADYRFFYISWTDVLGDLFFWRWLARFASESLFATDDHVQTKQQLFLPVVEWGVGETIRVMRDVPGLDEASYFSKAGSVEVVSQAGAGFGLKTRSSVASREEAFSFEPLLSTNDDADERSFRVNKNCQFGQCESFTQCLADYCQRKLPVQFACGTRVYGFEKQGDRVAGVHTSRGYVEIGEGLLVLCGGAWSGVLCDMLGIFCPIYPLKGYTLLVGLGGSSGPDRLVFNNTVYAVPSGPRLRIASIGGLGGWSVDVDRHIEAAVQREGARLLPRMADVILHSPAIAGLRPFSADEMPLIGKIPGFSNLLLNTGPGHTGWKCSAGFAAILAAAADDGVLTCGGDVSLESPNVKMLEPAGRLGSAVTGPRMMRQLLSFVV